MFAAKVHPSVAPRNTTVKLSVMPEPVTVRFAGVRVLITVGSMSTSGAEGGGNAGGGEGGAGGRDGGGGGRGGGGGALGGGEGGGGGRGGGDGGGAKSA